MTASLPSDFAEKAAKLSQRALRRHYGIGVHRMNDWFRSAGISARPRSACLALPADFAELARLSTSTELAKHYNTSWGVIARWRKECGVPAPVHLTPMPVDFARVAPTMTRHALRLRYDCGDALLSRWLAEAGVKTRGQLVFKHTGPRQAPGTQRDMSLTGRAADHLRKLGPVWRCNADGQPDPKGTHWRRGIAILTDEELIERAKSKGFEPDEWARLPGTITEGARK